MLLSRLAEHVYWAGRYLERAEGTAQMVRATTELYLDLPRSVSVGWRPLLAVTGAEGSYEEVVRTDGTGAVATEEHQIVGFLTTRSDNPGSVLASITAARTNLRAVRALLPRRGWEVANSLFLWATENDALAVPRRSRLDWLGEIVQRCHTVAGVLDATMSHDDAYAFLQIGRHLERADLTTRVIDVQAAILLDHRLGDGTLPYADVTWMGVLKSVSAMQMFRRVARAGVSGPRALDFLLCDSQFPRSVEFCLTELSRRLLELPHHDDAMAACAAAQQTLTETDLTGLSGTELHRFVDVLQTRLGAINAAIADTWFAPVPAAHARIDLDQPDAPSPTQSQGQRSGAVHVS
ncbi:alpha-E domain-containing protein [Euzebya sp.]|uniref:alpha-E domain-containing protein n=1 Tax=Euzebya sp. TaxID=1971409 RepID=UPI003512FAF8